MAPAVLQHPEARPKGECPLSEYSVDPRTPAGDPFRTAAQDRDHPHACLNGYVYFGYTAVDEETGEEVERVEALPCRRCAEEAR
jgi:hypothetical protein